MHVANTEDSEIRLLETQHETISRRVRSLETQIEEQKIIIALVQAKKSSLDPLTVRYAEAAAAASRLSADISERRRRLDQERTEAANQAHGEHLRQTREAQRSLYETFAPLLAAAVTAATKLHAMPGGISLARSWAATWGNRSDRARLTSTILADSVEKVLSGENDFLVAVIRDLEAVAPDLVTVQMKNFTADFQSRANERYRQQPRGDAKTLAAASFDEWRRHDEAMRTAQPIRMYAQCLCDLLQGDCFVLHCLFQIYVSTKLKERFRQNRTARWKLE